MPNDPVLLRTIIDLGRALPATTNLGRSGDTQDLYYLLDYLTFAVHRAYPFILCKDGCSGCCTDSGIPRTSQAEWDLIREHLDTAVAPDVLARIRARVQAHFRPALAAMDEFSAELTSLYLGGKPSAELKEQLPCLACPLLENDRCTVYEVRPAICRGYGYFTIRLGQEEPSLFTCRMSADDMNAHMKAAGEENQMLPAWNRFADQVIALNPPGAPIRFLPQWLVEWAGEPDGTLPEPAPAVPPPARPQPFSV